MLKFRQADFLRVQPRRSPMPSQWIFSLCSLVWLAPFYGCTYYDDSLLRRPTGAGPLEEHDSAAEVVAVSGDEVALDVVAFQSDEGGPDGISPRQDAAADRGSSIDAGNKSDAEEAATTAREDSGGDSKTIMDGASEPAPGTCRVDFTVTGVLWADAGPDAAARSVYLVGDAAVLGVWMPLLGVPISEISAGTWSGNVTLLDQQLIQFKFVKVAGGAAPEWEAWNPLTSNRTMRINCSGDAGPPEGGASDGGPAPGKSYLGVFGTRPPDATN
jgi:hypothetical protein